MQTSASPKRNAEPPAAPQRSHYRVPLVLIAVLGVLAVLTVLAIVAPASLVGRFLPPSLRAEDFSGSLWHGSAGKIFVNTRNAGAIEWWLHPGPLLMLTLAADVHWVKIGFVADGSTAVDRHGATMRDVVAAGPIEDLGDLGLADGWHGTTQIKFSELKLGFDDASGGGALTVLSAVGDINVSDLASPRIAAGADLGGYSLHLANGAITPDADATAELTDTGGPLQVEATLHFSPKDHLGLLSGTVKERPGASPALRGQLENLTQLHARDAQGRIPVELEFTL